MNILIFTTEYPPSGSVVVHEFAREWVRLGHRVDVLYQVNRLIFPLYLISQNKHKRQGAGKKITYELEGVNIIKFPITRFLPYPWSKTLHSVIKAKKVVKSVIQDNKYDIVISHYCSKNLFLVDYAQTIWKHKLISVFHSCDMKNESEIKKIISMSQGVCGRSVPIINQLKNLTGKQTDIFYVRSGLPENILRLSPPEKDASNIYRFLS